MKTPRRIPVQIAFAPELARQECWGRLLRLSASRAELSTLARLRPGERIYLGFELGYERFAEFAAEVRSAEQDADGFCTAELAFTDEVQKRALARALLAAAAFR